MDRFAALYVDLLDASRPAPDSATIPPPADSLLHQHGISLTEYRATVAWLNAEPSRWKEVLRQGILLKTSGEERR